MDSVGVMGMCKRAGIILSNNLRDFGSTGFEFVESDIEGYQPQVTHLSIMDKAYGMILFYETKNNPKLIRTAQLAEKNLSSSLRNMLTPHTVFTLCHLAVFGLKQKENYIYWYNVFKKWLHFTMRSPHIGFTYKRRVVIVKCFYSSIIQTINFSNSKDGIEIFPE